MNIGRLFDAARYPHKWSALPYIARRPSLLLGLSGRARAYLSRAIEDVAGADLPEALGSVVPQPVRERFKALGGVDDHGWRFLLYLLVRRYQPEVFVETGVSRGASTAYILAAMEENGKGRLYSIDLPPPAVAVTPAPGESTQGLRLADGQWFRDPQGVADLVPDVYKGRWTFIQGDATVELPRLLEKLGQIDVFFHDSLHTYEHMMFEFEASWPRLRPGGILLSHDVVWNSAWREFAARQGVSTQSIYHSLGMMRKPGGAKSP
jgi:predicted O-methyltransferase YrrM